ncbi:MAG: hypothetical protein LBE12_01210 [Planctomycetaceae bacterium]|nr:hypothetical protein [Planctomycetaceae bacterium]
MALNPYDIPSNFVPTNNSTQLSPPRINWNGQSYTVNGLAVSGDTRSESVAACVTGILYNAIDWHNNNVNNLNTVKDIKAINVDFSKSSNTAVNITCSNTSHTLEFGTGSKAKIPFASVTDRNIYIQNHWGSGVIFKSIIINSQ